MVFQDLQLHIFNMQRPEYVVPSIYGNRHPGSYRTRPVPSRADGHRRRIDGQRRPSGGPYSRPASGRAPEFCQNIPPPRLIISPKLSTAGPTPEAVSASNVLWTRLNTGTNHREPLLPTPTARVPNQESWGFGGGYPEKCRRPELEKDEEWKFLYEKPLEGNEQQKNPEDKGPQDKEQVEAVSQHHGNLAAPAPKVPVKTPVLIDLTGDSDDEQPTKEDDPERVAEIEKMQQENVEKKKSIQEEPISPSSSPHNSQDSQDPRSSSTLPLPLKSIKMELAADPMEDHETRLLEKMRAFCPARVEEIMRMQRENRERKEALTRNSGCQKMNKLSGPNLLDPNKEGTILSRSTRTRSDRRPRYAISPPRTQKEFERSFRGRRRESYHRDRWDGRGSSQYSRDCTTRKSSCSSRKRKMSLTNTDQVLDRVRIRLVQLIASLPASADGYLIPLRHQIQQALMTQQHLQHLQMQQMHNIQHLQQALIGHMGIPMTMGVPVYHMVSMVPTNQIEQLQKIQQWQQQQQQLAFQQQQYFHQMANQQTKQAPIPAKNPIISHPSDATGFGSGSQEEDDDIQILPKPVKIRKIKVEDV
ncbi:hypothetical protein B9Z55_007493 [Caenorhabditis nigoni]|uniref:Uncharacterized protein n=1 Tax=Caenorhabditis nigoni TaxID=1611254 RepID=A0A2G5V9W3_9PELO|nr:hypothetical protein B9Z55_007493 [Caenorhabditis nigoni]